MQTIELGAEMHYTFFDFTNGAQGFPGVCGRSEMNSHQGFVRTVRLQPPKGGSTRASRTVGIHWCMADRGSMKCKTIRRNRLGAVTKLTIQIAQDIFSSARRKTQP